VAYEEGGMPATNREINFTKQALEKLSPLKQGRYRVYDSATRGLGVLVHPNERRVFFWYRRVRGVPRWHSIGDFGELSIEKARAKAGEFNLELANWKADGYTGRSLKLEKRSDLTLKAMNEDYCERHLKNHAKNPDRAIKEVKATFDNHLAQWQDRTPGSISRSDVRELHAAIGKKTGTYAANRVLQNLRALFNFALKEEIYSGENPAARIQQFHEARRTRFLQPDELKRLFAAVRDEPNQGVSDYILLLMMTGVRKGNLLEARWDQITFETSSWDIPDPKNREPYSVALIPEALDILKRRQKNSNGSPWVFTSINKPGNHVTDYKNEFSRVLKRAGITGLRQHDVRRTLGAWQAAQGASLQMIGKSLGHKSLAASEIYSPMMLDPVRSSVKAATSAMFLAAKTNRQKLLAAAPRRKKLAARSAKQLKAESHAQS
jgi:integrase